MKVIHREYKPRLRELHDYFADWYNDLSNDQRYSFYFWCNCLMYDMDIETKIKYMRSYLRHKRLCSTYLHPGMFK